MDEVPKRSFRLAVAIVPLLVVAAVLSARAWPGTAPRTPASAQESTSVPSVADHVEAVLAESRQLARARAQAPKRLRVIVHRVEPGESLWSIAERYGTDVDSLLASNDIDRYTPIAPGLELRVPPVPGRIYTVEPGDTLEGIAGAFDITVQAVASANGLDAEEVITPGQELILPGARAASGRAVVASVARTSVSRADAGASRYIWPAHGPITSRYGPRWGRRHSGIDIGAPNGGEVVAARRGVVVSAGWRGPYGLAVELDHGGGVTTLYAHLSRIYVSAGEALQAGETIGLVGSTGESTGPHLHFEIRRNDDPIDPLPYLP